MYGTLPCVHCSRQSRLRATASATDLVQVSERHHHEQLQVTTTQPPPLLFIICSTAPMHAASASLNTMSRVTTPIPPGPSKAPHSPCPQADGHLKRLEISRG
eukprot:jgi/Ulvmu1/12591/UM092_0021.1